MEDGSKVVSLYSPESGGFVGRVVSGTSEAIQARCERVGLLWVEGEHDHLSKRVDIATGEVVDYQPPAPADDADKTWSWDDAIKRWAPTATLGAVKRAQWAGVKAAAEQTNQSDITIGGKSYTATDAARASLYQQVQIAQMAVADGLPFSVDVILADDETVVTLNANQIKAGVRALHDREERIKAKARTLRSAIFSAATSAEVVAVVWTWP